MSSTETRQVRCKPYHRPLRGSDAGRVRDVSSRKSRCPAWAGDPRLQQRLLDEALIDPGAGVDWAGRPRRLWNAVGGWFFVGVSTSEPQAAYNCYPEIPATSLRGELLNRAERTIEDVLRPGQG